MNTTKIATITCGREYKLGELVLKNAEVPATAFVGTMRFEMKPSLYLITYDRIIPADDPAHSWANPDCEVYVHHFCDVEIKEL